jgi:NADH:ubiquinone oxidoreductase subunit 6 (subunit J)
MNLVQIIFYFFAMLTVASAGYIIFTKNILHAAFALLCTFLGIAALYVLAYADFLAITQIMIYIGGVLILLIFGIMLTHRVEGQNFILSENRNLFWGIVTGAGLFGVLLYIIIKINFSAIQWISEASAKSKIQSGSTLGRIGENLMTDYILPFEAGGIILLVALIGAAFIAGQSLKSDEF